MSGCHHQSLENAAGESVRLVFDCNCLLRDRQPVDRRRCCTYLPTIPTVHVLRSYPFLGYEPFECLLQAELRDEDKHIADRIRRLTRSVDELEEEYDKHLSWCTSPGMSPFENGFLQGDAFAPAVTDGVAKAASTSRLLHLSETWVENGMDGDDGSSSPSSPSPRRTMGRTLSMFEHSVAKSKSVDFSSRGLGGGDMEIGAGGGLVSSGRKTSSSNWSPSSVSRRPTRHARSPSTNEQELSGHISSVVPVRSSMPEQGKDHGAGLLPVRGSIKKRHSFDVLPPTDAEVNSFNAASVASTLPRGVVLRLESEPCGVPDITYTAEPGRVYETVKEKSERNASDCTPEGTLMLPMTMPVTRSASTGGMVTPQRRVVRTLPRNQLHEKDAIYGKIESPKMFPLKNDLKLHPARSCQSLPRGMNPRMLRMYRSAESEVDPYLDIEDNRARAKRSQSYEGLDQFCDQPDLPEVPSRSRQPSKRWKLPSFFSRKS